MKGENIYRSGAVATVIGTLLMCTLQFIVSNKVILFLIVCPFWTLGLILMIGGIAKSHDVDKEKYKN